MTVPSDDGGAVVPVPPAWRRRGPARRLLAVFETARNRPPGLGAGWVRARASVAAARSGRQGVALGPADLVTGTRRVLACAVAALVADSFVGHAADRVLGAITAVALALDAVDGRVARRDRHPVRVRRPVRRRGRRVPAAGPQRVRSYRPSLILPAPGCWRSGCWHRGARYVFAWRAWRCPGCALRCRRATGARW